MEIRDFLVIFWIFLLIFFWLLVGIIFFILLLWLGLLYQLF